MYRLILWDNQKEVFLKEHWFRQEGETHIGRHPSNVCFIDHPGLAQFHLQVKSDGHSLCIATVPGAPPLTKSFSVVEFLLGIKRPRLKTKSHEVLVPSTGGRYRLNQLTFDFLGPGQVKKSTWPKHPSLTHPAQAQIKSTHSVRTFLGNRILYKPFLLVSLLCVMCWISYAPLSQKLKPQNVSSSRVKPTAVEGPIKISRAIPSVPTTNPTPPLVVHNKTHPTQNPKKKSPRPDPFEKAAVDFLSGKEAKAVSDMLALFETQPFTALGAKAGEFAKKLGQIQKQRLLHMTKAKNTPATAWQQLSEFEKDVLGSVSQRTKTLALQHLGREASSLMAEEKYQKIGGVLKALNAAVPSRKEWPTSLTEQLDQLAEKNYRKAYTLSQIDPSESREILSELLLFIEPRNPFHKKAKDLLVKLK